MSPLRVIFLFSILMSFYANAHVIPHQHKKKSISAGGEHACALLSDGSVKCWGKNFFGQLGLGHRFDWGDEEYERGPDLPEVDLGTGRSAKAISAGTDHTCALLDNDQIKCWGRNDSSALGIGRRLYGDSIGIEEDHMGDNLPEVDLGSGRSAKAVAAGNDHTCAILDNDRLKCWGSNYAGTLGLDKSTSHGIPWRKSDMGDNLPYVNLGTGRTVKSVHPANSFTCAILDNDKVKCWGSHFQASLGLEDIDTGMVNHFQTYGIGDNPGEMGDNLPYLDFGNPRRKVVSLSTRGASACALFDNGRFKCWGHDGSRQLGLELPHPNDQIGDDAGEMGYNLRHVDIGNGQRAQTVVMGRGHACAVLTTGQLKCWGKNSSYQLGLGDKARRGQKGTMGNKLPMVNLGAGRTIDKIALGGGNSRTDGFTCAILDNEEVKCWGYNKSGQLGQGHTRTMGHGNKDYIPAIDL